MNAPHRHRPAEPAPAPAQEPPRADAPPASSLAARDPLEGTPYRAVRRLGAGGMGEVFEAVHVGLNKPIVVKLLHQAIAGEPRFADRLRVEAQTLASVESPYLVSVSDIGCTPDGRPFFVMERLHGATLRQALDLRGALPPGEAIDWSIQVLRGLAAAHHIGIVHRDVKLDNLFLCDPTAERGPLVKVLDFGIAKVLQGAGLPFPGPKYATEEGHLVGSPRYVSPEQVRFEPVDARTDVYAVGVVLYTLLVGHGPFPGATDMLALLNAHLLEIPPPPSTVASQHIAPELDRVVLQAMAKRPEARFQSADLFIEELRRTSNAIIDRTQPLLRRHAQSPDPVEALDHEAATPTREFQALDEEATAEDAPTGQSTARGTWIMVPPAGARPITALPANLVEPAAAGGPNPPNSPAPPAPPDGRIFLAVTLASSVLFSAVFAVALRLLGLL